MVNVILNTQNIKNTIQSASRVIVPLSPISIFAARHPWANMEEQTFEEVARWIKETQEINMYANKNIIKSAIKKEEINEYFISNKLEDWLEKADYKIDKEELLKFAQKALKGIALEDEVVKQYEKELKQHYNVDEFNLSKNKKVKMLSAYQQSKSGEPYSDILNYHIIKWCKLYLDNAQSGWSMPTHNESFYNAWKKMVVLDPALNKNIRQQFKNLPEDSIEAMECCLDNLNIEQQHIQSYLESHLISLPGWAGMMLWHDEKSNQTKNLLQEYLTIRLALEWSLIGNLVPEDLLEQEVDYTSIVAWLEWGDFTLEKWLALPKDKQKEYIRFSLDFDEIKRKKILLEAWEDTYELSLRQEINSHHVNNMPIQETKAQLAFCIDTRSEPFRRQLEMEGPFETIGIAGFFGLPIEKCELGHQHTHNSLPVMNKPLHKIQEFEANSNGNDYVDKKKTVSSLIYTFKKMKQNVLPSLLLPELTGPWLSIQTITRSFMPKSSGNIINKFNNTFLKKPETTLTINEHEHNHGQQDSLPIGFTEKEKINYTAEALKLMSLTEGFAPLVVICGHGSHTANNPYSASLDCGACGGSASGFNAKVLATLCNLPEVRTGLLKHHIFIPEETVFIAAEHCTTIDELEWIYVPELSKEAEESYILLKNTIPEVSRKANELRLTQLPGIHYDKKNATKEAKKISSDWSEVRPEWGLARNASFIIGQRQLTKKRQLNGRSFLHNYDWRKDQDGVLLNTILTGPATVSQWINLQYYASTVAPHFYGSGSKATQTVTSGIGVMQGNASDLLTGLPWQSVMKSDEDFYHSPIRLLIVIQAPNHYIERLLNKNEALNTKLKNGWLLISSINEHGEWVKW
ncbi:DUF2309 domain-containing protein [Mammaliicoccus lentus]|uniref:DUF2309 domain-containing protein n=1 Tax=Mammaliicoccus lentus TaxID=42858 RepID=UPI0026488087|nr:putative inorganic carbon transporter subunit DabA [Mammaliicoccus lentus]